MSGDAGLRHPMKRARGLGSAGSGLHHWWMQRVTAVALAPLSVWFVWHASTLFLASHQDAVAFLSGTVDAVLMLLFTASLLYHSYLGLQVVVEDYVTREAKKLATLVALQFVHWALGIAATLAIVKLVAASTFVVVQP